MKLPRFHWGSPFGAHRYYGLSWYGFQIGYWTKVGDTATFAIIHVQPSADAWLQAEGRAKRKETDHVK